MSLKSTFAHLFGSKAGQATVAFAVTETQKAVAALKTTSIGAAVAADIAAVASKTLTNPEKFEAVVANTAPLIVEFVSHPGAPTTALADVESVARELVQSTYNDTKSTVAGTVAGDILHLLGIA